MLSSTSSTSSSSSSIKSPTSFHHPYSSFNMSRSYSSKYHPQLKQSTSNSKHIDRLSKQYTDVNLINQLLSTNPSSHLTTSTNPERTPTPNKLTISTSLSLTSSTTTTTLTNHHDHKIEDQKNHFNDDKINGLMSPPLSPPSFSSTSFPPRSTSLKPNLNLNSSIPSPPSSLIITSHKKASYSSMNQTTSSSSTPKRLSKIYPDHSSTLAPFSPPISPKVETNHHFQYPIITPIQKNNGMKIRSFFGQSILLNKMIRIEQRQDDMDLRFFIGKNEMTNQPQKILKLNIMYGHHDTFQEMAPFGIYFTNLASSNPLSSSSTFNENNNSIPDSLIMDALSIWLNQSNLPHLASASHILRENAKLYVVYHDKI
ncbi:unnamed protein product [Cunninghamella blakesleeana]